MRSSGWFPGLILGGTLAAVLTLGATAAAQDRAGPRDAARHDAFLRGLEGQWSVVAEAVPGPGRDPVRTESREVARLLGGQWLVAETTGTLRGRPFTWILTLGYDPARERFVATWVDSNQTRLWSYAGQLDESGSRLTLATEGPVRGSPGKTTRYREVLEIRGPDHKVMRSLILGPDGEWFEYARADFRRDP